MTWNSGYRFDLENVPKLKATALRFACTAAEIPEEIDCRPWIHCENQGQMSSCYGHAASTVAEHINYVASGGDKTQASRMFCYLTGQREAGIRGDNGCFIEAGVKALKKYGVCREETFPYPSGYSDAIPGNAYTEGVQHLFRSHTMHESTAELIQFSGRGVGGTIGGIPWYESFANHRGPVITGVSGRLLGYHAVAFIGYDRQGRPRLFNSHDLGWGEDGSACVAVEVMDWLFQQPNTVFAGVSDMPTFVDRKIPDWRRLYG